MTPGEAHGSAGAGRAVYGPPGVPVLELPVGVVGGRRVGREGGGVHPGVVLVGHVMQRTDLLEKTLILGKTEGRRVRPPPLGPAEGVSGSCGRRAAARPAMSPLFSWVAKVGGVGPAPVTVADRPGAGVPAGVARGTLVTVGLLGVRAAGGLRLGGGGIGPPRGAPLARGPRPESGQRGPGLKQGPRGPH